MKDERRLLDLYRLRDNLRLQIRLAKHVYDLRKYQLVGMGLKYDILKEDVENLKESLEAQLSCVLSDIQTGEKK